MKNSTELQVALLSSMLFINAHPARDNSGLRYTAFIFSGTNMLLSSHFALRDPFVRDNVLVMESSEIQLHDGAALLVEDFLKRTAASVASQHTQEHAAA